MSDGLKGSSEVQGALRVVTGHLGTLATLTSFNDKTERNNILGGYADFAPALKRVKTLLKEAVTLHDALLFGSVLAPFNVGPGLAQVMLERALDSDTNVDLYSYVIARLDGLRYAGTRVAKEVDRIGLVYSKKDNLYQKFMTYTVISTLLSPGIVNRIVGDAFHVGGVIAWPDVNFWLSRWGVSVSVETRLRFGDRFELLLGYEGLAEPFADTSSLDFGSSDVVLDGMNHMFLSQGNESYARDQFVQYLQQVDLRDDIRNAYLFARSAEEYAAQSGRFGSHKVFEVVVGGDVALTDQVGVKVKGYFNSSDNVPVGFSGSLTIKHQDRMSICVGVDSLSPNSMVGNRMFVFNQKTEEKDRETCWWMELDIVC